MDAALIVINRTNNALKRFNRKLGDAFSRAHPNMVQFVQGINAISLEYVALLEDIRRGRVIPDAHQDVNVFQIPEEYNLFKALNHV